jgi:hypothetical protein
MFLSQQAAKCVDAFGLNRRRPTGSRRAAPEPESEDEELPFACFICREPWDAPGVTPAVVTRCGHYYHQSVRASLLRQTLS